MTTAQVQAKITKLLALAGSPNEHEAYAALKMAQTLANKYGVELGECREKTTVTETVAASESDLPLYKRWIGQVLATNFNVLLVKQMGLRSTFSGGKPVKFWALAAIGHAEDVAAFKAAYNYTVWYYSGAFAKARKAFQKDLTATKARLSKTKTVGMELFLGSLRDIVLTVDTRKSLKQFDNNYIAGFITGLEKEFEQNVKDNALVLCFSAEVEAERAKRATGRARKVKCDSGSSGFLGGYDDAQGMGQEPKRLQADSQGVKQLEVSYA